MSEYTNFKNQSLGFCGVELLIKNVLTRKNLDKHKRLYLIQHSRTMHLCKHLKETQMYGLFGLALDESCTNIHTSIYL